jgi:hypothetical protein
MDEKRWFLLHEGQVVGPFAQAEVESQAATYKNPLVWGKGQSEWMTLEKWAKVASDIVTGAQKPKTSDRVWKIRIAGQEMQPMDHDQMIEALRKQTDYTEVQIWTEGYSEWKDIYQIHKIMDELGVSRRQHPRVPIMGTLQCEAVTGTFTAQAQSIGAGGLGVTGVPADIKIGEKLKTILKSPNLPAPVHSTCEVVYIGQDGYAGMKFVTIQAEAQAGIVEYVKKFT